jgi:glycosyltransferase involved in cell wall biosynthesis
MKVIVHDFSGHPSQAELSRKLADSGLEVDHVSAEQYVSGKGHLEVQPGDSPTLSFTGISLGLPFQKYAPLARLRFERAYAREWIARLKAAPVDVVVACNLPLVSMFLFARHARRTKLPYVMWHQDIYSSGLSDELHRKFPRPLARLGARVFERMEAYCARHARHVVAIGDAFKEVYPGWKVAAKNVSVIPNWAPLDKVFPVDRTNPRSGELFPEQDSLRLVYAGTIGRKHNPKLLVDLVRNALDNDIAASMVVISQGEAADDLTEIADTEQIPLTVLPFQPADDLPFVLGSADVLVALLEPDATKFSIPSKVLSYMAAGRPILGLMPGDNPAAIDIKDSGGFVADPSDVGAKSATAWLSELAANRGLVEQIGQRTRTIAEQKFDVDGVARQFDAILTDAVTAQRT